jgi:hypothetical protein
MKKTLNEQGFRKLVRRIVQEQLESGELDEYVANDDSNPHKDVHADPTGRNWDSGLDEADLDEYVANDDENPHKKVHADPSGRNWDSGLDEADESRTYGASTLIADEVGDLFERLVAEHMRKEYLEPVHPASLKRARLTVVDTVLDQLAELGDLSGTDTFFTKGR